MSDDLAPPCKWVGKDEPRILPSRHNDDCEGGDCAGCQECPETHCLICGVNHVPDRTCPGCVHDVRANLTQIEDFMRYPLLEQALFGGSNGRLVASAPIPGGDASVMLMPYSLGSSDQLERWTRYDPETDAWVDFNETEKRHLNALDLPRDAPHPLLVLATWEDDWRTAFGHGGGPDATIGTAVDYLDRNLARAAQEHPAFDDFAKEIHDVRTRLESLLHDGDRLDQANVACFDCGGELVKHAQQRRICRHHWEAVNTGTDLARWIWTLATYPELGAEHAACHQGGADDHWTCKKCRREYTDQAYNLAIRAKIETASA